MKIKTSHLKNFNQQEFSGELYDPVQSLELTNAQNANFAYSIFHKKFQSLLNKHAPLRFLSRREVKLKQKPWIPKGILKSIKVKRNLLKIFKKTSNQDTFLKYKLYRKTLNILRKNSKKMYYKQYFEKHIRNSKRTWSQINKILNRKSVTSKNTLLNVNGQLIDDNKKIANTFNRYFVNVAENLSKQIQKPNTEFQDYLKNPNMHSLFLKETTPHEISIIIANFDQNKSSDIYEISPKIIKQAGPALSNLLTIISNKSIKEGIFPDALKVSKILPLHKSDSVFEVSNYRPISLLPIISKIFEKLIFVRLNEFITKHQILYQNQFGFQKNKSTELAVNSIVSNVTKSLENKESAYCIFLDFAKAFDTVNHDILIQKLDYYGIRGNALNLFKSYLTERQQFTEIGDTLSDMEYIKCGVPQGSILGPILFLLYINDITESSTLLKFYLFADDTTLFYSCKADNNTEVVLNNELSKVSSWLASNKLSLNVAKSNFLSFSFIKHTTIKLNINSIPLIEKQNTKYLGVIIDNKLDWKTHIQAVNTKLSKGIGLLSRIRHYVPKNVLKSLYYSFINPHIEYNLLNWSCTSKTNLECINTSMKKAIRIITFSKRQDHTLPLFHKLEILPLDSCIKLKQATFMWKFEYNFLPTAIMANFNTYSSEIITRLNMNKIRLPSPRLNIAKRLLTFEGVKLWNNEIPNGLKHSTSLRTFTKKYRSFLLSQLT